MKVLLNSLLLSVLLVNAQDLHFNNHRDTNGDLLTTDATEVVTTCDDALTVTVVVPFDKTATVITAPCEGEWHQAQASDNTIYIQLNTDVASDNYCELTEGKVHFEIGRTGVSTDPAIPDFTILFSKMFVEVDCDPEREYKVKYTYGELESDDTNQTAVHGQVVFSITAMDETFTDAVTAPVAAGVMTHLALSVNSNLDMAQYQFMPRQCIMQSEDKSLEFSIFDTTGVYENDIIDLSVEYDVASNVWRISHILFMLGARSKQNIYLFCNVIVCDITAENNECVSNPWTQTINQAEDSSTSETTEVITASAKVWTKDHIRLVQDNQGRTADCQGDRAGRVELYAVDQWMSICDDGWSLEYANVVCQHLFGTDAMEFLKTAQCGESVASDVPREVTQDTGCDVVNGASIFIATGTYGHVGNECSYITQSGMCTKDEDSGVICN